MEIIDLQTKINNTNLPQKKLSKDTACWPNINWCCIFCGTKYEFWSSVVARANVRNICFTIHLCIEKFISIKMHQNEMLQFMAKQFSMRKEPYKKRKKSLSKNSEMLGTSSALTPTVNSKNTSRLACQNLIVLVKNFSSIANKRCKNLTAKGQKVSNV